MPRFSEVIIFILFVALMNLVMTRGCHVYRAQEIRVIHPFPKYKTIPIVKELSLVDKIVGVTGPCLWVSCKKDGEKYLITFAYTNGKLRIYLTDDITRENTFEVTREELFSNYEMDRETMEWVMCVSPDES